MIKTYRLDSVKAIILVGNPDFGRCKLATRLNRALWPLAGRPVLQRLIEHIANQGVRRFVICCSKGARQVQSSLEIPPYLSVDFRFEDLPRGTAGSIRDAVDRQQDELIFVFPAAIIAPPDLHDLIRIHREKAGWMTIFFNPANELSEGIVQDAQIYVCQPQVMEYIPSLGYFDLKENLVPTLVQAGKTIVFGQLSRHAGNYRHWHEYLLAVQQYLLALDPHDPLLNFFHAVDPEERIWIGNHTIIDPTATLIGPALIGDNVYIGPDTLLLGPLLIEPGVQVHPGSLVSESVLFKESQIGPGCQIQHCLVDEKKALFSRDFFTHRLIVHSKGIVSRLVGFRKMPLRKTSHKADLEEVKKEPIFIPRLFGAGNKIGWVLLGVCIVCSLLGAYWNPTLIELWKVWLESDEYSSGLLVPILACYILWDRRHEILACPIRPVPWAALFLIGAQCLRMGGLLIGSPAVEQISLWLTIGILVWMVLGVRVAKRIIPIWLYLMLMFPIPGTLESYLTVPLQKWASVSAVFGLETLGFHVIREGNIININGTLVAVAEACNGLRMLTAFFVVTGFVVFLTRRPLWEKGLILISSVPIALLCNTIRLTLTSIAFLYLKTEMWEKAFHDYGGLAMMPLALGITLFELWILSKLIIGPEGSDVRPDIITRNQ
jgi:exosortase